MLDLTTRYLRLTPINPLIASASPFTADIGNLRRLEDCGAAALVLPSIFEEKIEAEAAETERLTTFRGESFPDPVLRRLRGAAAGAGAQAEKVVRIDGDRSCNLARPLSYTLSFNRWSARANDIPRETGHDRRAAYRRSFC